jgi:uncharacterized delta-60 repeat protein
MKTFIRVVALTPFLLVTLAGPASALPGELDPSFGDGGIVSTRFVKSASAEAIAIQPDGKIVAVGTIGYRHAHFALARYNPDGTLDVTFGGDGKVLTSFTKRFDVGLAVALQGDGKIVAAGRAGGYRGTFAIARYNLNGTLDPTFSGDGKVQTDLTRKDDEARAVGIEPDGAIVAAGFAGATRRRFAIVRYSADGSLDTSFGGDGKVFTKLTRGDNYATAMAIEADGRVVVAGRAGGDGGRFALVRYVPDGSLDTTFGGDGKVLTNFSRGDDFASSVLIQSNGQIVVAGTAGEIDNGWFSDTEYALARYGTDGSLDPTFGGDGRVRANLTGEPDYANALAIQGDGMIVVAGTAVSTASCCESFTLVARFASTGVLDQTFGDGGKVFTTYETSQGALAVAVQPDDKIVIAGASECYSGKCKFSLLRYLGT